MKAHKLARLLLAGPNKPVFINGWGSDEGLGPFAVSEINLIDGELFFDYDPKKAPRKPGPQQLLVANIREEVQRLAEKIYTLEGHDDEVKNLAPRGPRAKPMASAAPAKENNEGCEISEQLPEGGSAREQGAVEADDQDREGGGGWDR